MHEQLKSSEGLLAGCRVIEHGRSVAASYAGHLLAAMGAEVIMLEPPGGSPLRHAEPLIKGTMQSALFSYLAAGKRSLVKDLSNKSDYEAVIDLLRQSAILIDDSPFNERLAQGLGTQQIAQLCPHLVHVSVLPFGAHGNKAEWQAEEVNLIHASGEGFLLPNGLSRELFPERAPLKIHGHFAAYQGGCMAAMAALSAWWQVQSGMGQYVDVSVQDTALLVGAFALQRLGDGSLEHRASRSFRYGGVFETSDGYVELLTLEDRQWQGLVQLLGSPAWALAPELSNPLVRSERGDAINVHIRAWMKQQKVDAVVEHAQALGVPAAKYRSPDEVFSGEQERTRGLFRPMELDKDHMAQTLWSPFDIGNRGDQGVCQVPALNEYAPQLEELSV